MSRTLDIASNGRYCLSMQNIATAAPFMCSIRAMQEGDIVAIEGETLTVARVETHQTSILVVFEDESSIASHNDDRGRHIYPTERAS